METLQSRTKKKWHNIDIQGNWILTYTVRNNMGAQAFGGVHIGTYKSPFDGSKVYRRSVDNKPLMGFMMDKLSIKLDPDNNEDHKLLISFLICSPEVQLEGFKKGTIDPIILKSKTGTKITLTCKDYVEFEEIEEEDYIDKIIGRLSLDNGKYSIGIDRLREILAYLNMSYRDNRFKGESEKKALRSKLKTWTRKSYENAKKVQLAIDSTEEAKGRFQFKEMLKHNVIVDFGGSYKYNNIALGSSYESVSAFFDNHPEVKTEAIQELYSIIN